MDYHRDCTIDDLSGIMLDKYEKNDSPTGRSVRSLFARGTDVAPCALRPVRSVRSRLSLESISKSAVPHDKQYFSEQRGIPVGSACDTTRE